MRYSVPTQSIRYYPLALVADLTEAKAAVLSLLNIPFQRAWAEKLQAL